MSSIGKRKERSFGSGLENFFLNDIRDEYSCRYVELRRYFDTTVTAI
jgi:hypothetical protein